MSEIIDNPYKKVEVLKKRFYSINEHFNFLIKNNYELYLKNNKFIVLIEKLKQLIFIISEKFLVLEKNKDIDNFDNIINEIKSYLIILNNNYNLLYQFRYCK